MIIKLGIFALLLAGSVGCGTVTSRPDLFPPEPRVWSLIPRDATVVVAVDVPKILGVIDRVLRSPDWDGTDGVRNVRDFRQRFRSVLGVDPGHVRKSVFVVHASGSNIYGGFLLYGTRSSVVKRRFQFSYHGQKIYRGPHLHVAFIADAVVVGDLRFVKHVLDIRYGLGSSKDVSSGLWMTHALTIRKHWMSHGALVADLSVLGRRFPMLAPNKLSYLAAVLNIDKGAMIQVGTEEAPLLERVRRQILGGVKLLRAALGLYSRLGTIPLPGAFALKRRDLQVLATGLGRIGISIVDGRVSGEIRGGLHAETRVVLKAVLAALKLVKRRY